MAAFRVRKQKLITVCSVENTSSSDNLVYLCHKNASSTTKLQTSIKSPINAYNLIMLEIYPESRSGDERLPLHCNKLHFISLCCGKNAKAEDIHYDFDEYQDVESVDFTGHIGSMRLAFDLLKNFKRLREVVFLINDYNVNFPNGIRDTFENIPRYDNMECVKILHDPSVVDQTTVDIQSSGASWRLDEFLEGCKNCFPNLKKFEVSVSGTGSNFDKINHFVVGHPILNLRYSVEITNNNNNQKVRIKPKQRSLMSNHRPQLAITSGEAAPPRIPLNAVDKFATTAAAQSSNVRYPIIDLSIVKKESNLEIEKGPSYPTLQATNVTDLGHINTFQSQCQLSQENSGSHLSKCNSVEENLLLRTAYLQHRTTGVEVPYLNYHGGNANLKAVCWKEDTFPICNAEQLSFNQPNPHPSKNVSSPPNIDGIPNIGLFQRLMTEQQRIASNSAFQDNSAQEEGNDPRLRVARNPSPPPPGNSPAMIPTAATSENSQLTSSMNTNTRESRRRVPSPPQISGIKQLVSYSYDGDRNSDSSGEVTNSSGLSEIREGTRRDPRGSRREYSRSRSVSKSPSVYTRKAPPLSPPSQYRVTAPPREERSGKSRGRRKDRSRTRSYSRSASPPPKPKSKRRTSRHSSHSSENRSRSPGEARHKRKMSKSHCHSGQSKYHKSPSSSYKGRSRSRSRSSSPDSSSPYTHERGEGSRRGSGYPHYNNYRGGYRGSSYNYNPAIALRRGRGRGIRGRGVRGRGRARGFNSSRGRGVKPGSSYSTNNFYDPRRKEKQGSTRADDTDDDDVVSHDGQ